MRIPSAEELAASGFTRADYEQSAEVWPENWPVWCLFTELGGQWRTKGMDGRVYALDYTPLLLRLDRMNLNPTQWADLYADVRVLEAAALDEMSRP